MKTQFDKFTKYNSVLFEEQNPIEVCLNVSDMFYENVLSLSGTVMGNKAEVSENVKYGGKVLFNLIYLGDNIERSEAGGEFSFSKNKPEGEIANVKAVNNVGEVSLKKQNGMLYAKAVITTKIYIDVVENCEYLSEISAFQKNELVAFPDKKFGVKRFTVEDEFETSKIKNVISSDAQAVIHNVQAGMGVVIVDGEIILKVCSLPFFENSDILKDERTVPFRLEVEIDGVTPEMTTFAKAILEKVSIKVYIDEEQNKSVFNVEFDICLDAFSESLQEKAIISDVYSNKNEINVEYSKNEFSHLVAYKTKKEKISGVFNADIPENSRFITLLGETLEIANIELTKEGANIDGIVKADALFFGDENIKETKKVILPVSFKVNDENIDNITVNLLNISTKLRSGRLESEINIFIGYNQYEKIEITTISSANEGELKKENNSAISVYLANAGDTEWDVTKETGLSGDEIFLLNPNITFPLKGNERIICFRRK